MEVTLALLPSPLLGPAVWAPVAQALEAIGCSVAQAPVARAAPRDPQDALDHFLSWLPMDDRLVLVPHSNAGLFVPSLVSLGEIVACVFVDAALPPAMGRTPAAPDALRRLLAPRADSDGNLPPWSQWWDEDLADLFPSAQARELVEREQPRLPMAYFDADLPAPAGWADTPGAYLAFGQTYAAEREQATAWGWPTRTMAGQHLHMLVDPDGVAWQVTALLGRLGLAR